MSELSFVPWVRHRLAQVAEAPSTTTPPGQTPPRPVVNVRVHLTADGAPVEALRPVQLYGPGDVTGLQPEAVIKTLPRAGEQQFPPNLLAAVEFYEEDLPWRFSVPPDAATPDRIIPWCFLLVLREDEYELVAQQDQPLPVVKVLRVDKTLPDGDQPLWPWAHVQTNRGLSTALVAPADAQETQDFLNGDLQANPDLALARLLSPRHLAPNTAYRACLVPTYEAGRRAGLGLPTTGVSLTQLAWPVDNATLRGVSLDLPVYYQWEFRTGDAGDFESLARLLHPGDTDNLVGRSFDVKVPAAAPAAGQITLALPTALRPIGRAIPPANATVSQYLLTHLAPAAAPLVRPTTGYQRPVVTAPVYGRYYHATGAQLVPRTADWKDTANLDVRYRAVAGLGAQAVQENQEDYMRRAWEQVSEVLVANAQLRGMQAGLQTTDALRTHHLPVTTGTGTAARAVIGGGTPPVVNTGSSLENYGLHLTGLAFSRLRMPGTTQTLQEAVRQSSFPAAALTPAFRRIAKPFGRYQESQAGRPLRPSLPAPQLQDGQEAALRGTSLQQRDALLGLIANGTITAAPDKPQFALFYQFDDEVLDGQLASPEWSNVLTFIRDGQTISKDVLSDDKENVFIRFRLNPLTGEPVRFFTEPAKRPQLDLDQVKQALLTGTDPKPVFLARANRALRLVPHYPATAAVQQPANTQQRLAGSAAAQTTTTGFELDRIQPLMAYPVFKDPVGELLRRKRPDLFLPGLDQLAENTLVALTPDPAFIEAYVLGANHAMGNELLWRNYPTDLRGSYFRQFWDVSEQRDLNATTNLAGHEEKWRDVKPLDQWHGALGDNPNSSAGTTGKLLLVVRAALLQRFPGTVVCAQPVRINSNPIIPDTANTLYPTKRMEISQDVVVFEFALSEATAIGDRSRPYSGYFFVFMERPGEAQFGLDETGPPSISNWADLSWNEDLLDQKTENLVITPTAPALPTNSSFAFKTLGDAAQVAYALYQQPFAAAIHARELLVI